ncbi:DUF2155 domain-containing protein [Rubellimicrobium rubrum]|uniref:DUF2155 domain-containing protein n=1 Tax=Rubellimicrobium rubrum TaxID=2585369 RepID=A0A5C4N775_9RHOB|nr:DUF2155 domain-containing protein [Rubellimicrobium rubrum]TNC52901.1 DUF2155 domain-containing protein [Rubellimicrobium rubrum]
MMRRSLLVALSLAAPAGAQDTLSITPPSRGTVPETQASSAAVSAPGGIVRVLDKITGTITDLDLRNGESGSVGNLAVVMGDCRFPGDNPAGDAFVLVSIRTEPDDTAVFEGWLIASAPALSALDHSRYDVWALRCLGAD